MSAVIAAICISTKKGVAKKPVAQAEFQVGFGIAGDVLDIMNLSHYSLLCTLLSAMVTSSDVSDEEWAFAAPYHHADERRCAAAEP